MLRENETLLSNELDGLQARIKQLEQTAASDGSTIVEMRDAERALRAEGYSVETTPASGDFGADLIAEKDGLRYAIQCKDLNKPVGVKGIQEAVSAKRHYLTDFACVACDAGFTDAAIELATSNKVVVSNLKSLAAQLELAR